MQPRVKQSGPVAQEAAVQVGSALRRARTPPICLVKTLLGSFRFLVPGSAELLWILAGPLPLGTDQVPMLGVLARGFIPAGEHHRWT